MRITLFLLILLGFLPVCAHAQQRQYSTTDKEAIKYYALASQSVVELLYD